MTDTPSQQRMGPQRSGRPGDRHHVGSAKSPGRIVNISSVGAFNYGGGGAALYSITKAITRRRGGR
jgi:NAD(P)-dependent dehydrogenase (short-subunit alcohol dehydrogenase family)